MIYAVPALASRVETGFKGTGFFSPHYEVIA